MSDERHRMRDVFAVPRLHEKTREDWLQMLRFCAVGASGYAVNLAVFSLLVATMEIHHAVAAVGAFLVAVTNNFLLNKYWTFQRHGESAAIQGARYLLVSVLALVLNLVVLEALIGFGVPEIPSQALAVLAVTPVNFLLNRRWTFVTQDEDARTSPSGTSPEAGPSAPRL